MCVDTVNFLVGGETSGTCEDAEKNCEEKELPQPMNKKSEIQWKERCNEYFRSVEDGDSSGEPLREFCNCCSPLCFTSFVMMTPFPSGLARAL